MYWNGYSMSLVSFYRKFLGNNSFNKPVLKSKVVFNKLLFVFIDQNTEKKLKVHIVSVVTELIVGPVSTFIYHEIKHT